jgi:putative transcriptional regulator
MQEMKTSMRRFTLDPNDPPRLGAAEAARLDALTDEEITAAALSDPDNPPLTDEELERLAAAPRVREGRGRTRFGAPSRG